MPDPLPQRDYEPCPISGQPIQNIFQAIADPRTGRPADFDVVLQRLTNAEPLGEGERIAYIGKGTFAVIKTERVEGRNQLVVRKRIQYEDSHDRHNWRRELAPGISRDYTPQPTPLSELYKPEEVARFPRFDSGGAQYNARSN